MVAAAPVKRSICHIGVAGPWRLPDPPNTGHPDPAASWISEAYRSPHLLLIRQTAALPIDLAHLPSLTSMVRALSAACE